MPTGFVVAVEVTRHNVRSETETRAAASGKDWRFATLASNWVVDMVPRYNVKEVHGQVARLLAEVEAAGLDRFDLKHGTPSGRTEQALVSLRQLGARLLYRLSDAPPGGGTVILGSTSVVGSTAPNVVAELVEHHANLPDNVRKLANADADERHLLIWVESAQHQAVAAMAFEVLPTRAPALPDHVDAAWVATGYDIAQVWRYSRRVGWEDLGGHPLGNDTTDPI